jgi:probable rRNA maturation factor
MGQPEPAGLVILVSNRQSVDVDEDGLSSLAERTLREEGRSEGELSISFVSAGEIQALHERYMDESGPTDVLAFPMDEDGLLGDVVICPEVAAGQGRDVEQELRLLVVHGVLHLLGYDHQEDADRAEMWARQQRYSGVHSP